jgi:hypothetical protein
MWVLYKLQVWYSTFHRLPPISTAFHSHKTGAGKLHHQLCAVDILWISGGRKNPDSLVNPQLKRGEK